MLSLPWRRSARTTGPARITAAALIGSAATVAALVATDVVPVPSWAIDGVDVSSHQHPDGAAIDWQALAASGQKFAFIKATEGTGYTNPYYSTDSLKAKEAGVTPGSYHYARPGEDARTQAQFYAASLATGAQPTLPPVLDMEETGGLGPEDLQAWTRDWVSEIKTLTGRDPIIYTYYNFWLNEMGNTTEFSNLPLWLAYYDDSLPNEIPGGWKQVTFWQYASDGDVDGVRTKVDLNSYYGSDQQLQQLANSMPNGTPAGDAANALEGLRGAAGNEANLVNDIEHATGVNIPLPSDFLMLLLGVAGGRIPVETLLTQGAAQIQAGAGADAGNNGSSQGGAQGSSVKPEDIQRAITALSQAFNELNAQGQKIPVDQLIQQVQANGGQMDVVQLLGLLQKLTGGQNWGAKLQKGQVQVDPNALNDLAKAAEKAQPANAGNAGGGKAGHGNPGGNGAAATAPNVRGTAPAGSAPAPAGTAASGTRG
ncbi:glycoside hydrolase family 25 protein [Corynebacterium heidelbergense]|uniref:Lysozyme n=1 Tax=Corynebacterium heidelbergense TaxID=2055947 RepID=A0A364V8A4_9CORY|nr:glycoside hydrolase family 25 protein [Corynebacterium heidelbergense]RAV32844.1 lysozyme [Corynebacterium heidelbergense]WCZ35675.1 Lysozyme M1 precursor [Corynebacterium heidelbergense]